MKVLINLINLPIFNLLPYGVLVDCGWEGLDVVLGEPLGTGVEAPDGELLGAGVAAPDGELLGAGVAVPDGELLGAVVSLASCLTWSLY